MSYLRGAARSFVMLAMVLGGVSGCSPSGPPPKIYVLGGGISAEPQMVSQLDKPTVEVRPARVPDYLDTTDIVTRGAGGLIVPSESGRWGERFSIGLARAVTAELRHRLPQLAITTSAWSAEPKWEVQIELDAFDVQPTSNSTLAATWSIIDVQRRRTWAEERVVLSDRGTFQTDAAVVAVMGHQVEDLAARIAESLAPVAGVGARQPRPG
jgi:uncharacterized lipoprotein YmbA